MDINACLVGSTNVVSMPICCFVVVMFSDMPGWNAKTADAASVASG